MQHVSSSDQQQSGNGVAGPPTASSDDHGDRGHSEAISSSSSISPLGEDVALEEDPRYLRRASATDEGRRWQLLRAFLTPFELVGEVLRIIMNAAVTIFGMGVGVGLILGDSFRPSSVEDAPGEGAPVREGGVTTNRTMSLPLEETGLTPGRAVVVVESVSDSPRSSLSDLPAQ